MEYLKFVLIAELSCRMSRLSLQIFHHSTIEENEGDGRLARRNSVAMVIDCESVFASS
tara:strand:+ start:5519 stop:5692 length:174 start_codon:yes stop_codon:yes gene_type:complete